MSEEIETAIIAVAIVEIELSDEIVIEAEIAQENAVETVILLANSTVAMIAALILVRNDRLCGILVALILVMLEILVVLTLVTLGKISVTPSLHCDLGS